MTGTHSFTHLLKPWQGSPEPTVCHGRHWIFMDGFSEKENKPQKGSEKIEASPLVLCLVDFCKINSKFLRIKCVFTFWLWPSFMLSFSFVHAFNLSEVNYLGSEYSEQGTKANLAEESYKKPCACMMKMTTQLFLS